MEFDQRISARIDTARQIIFILIFAGLAKEIITRPDWLQDLSTRNSVLYGLFFLVGVWVIFSAFQKLKQEPLSLGQKIMAFLGLLAAFVFCGSALIKLLLPFLNNL